MGQYKTISLSREGAIARLTFNRGAALNALSFEMMREIMDALSSLESDLDCSVLILEGAGRAFSVGFDLQNLAGMMSGGALPSESELEDWNLGRPQLFHDVKLIMASQAWQHLLQGYQCW